MKSSIYLFSQKETKQGVCVFFFIPFLSRVRPWRGLQYVSPLLPWKHAKPSADVHKIALEFVSNISHLPFCAWLGHASDRKWKTQCQLWQRKLCNKRHKHKADIFCSPWSLFCAYKIHSDSKTAFWTPKRSRIYEFCSALTREAQHILKGTENQECLWNTRISLSLRFLNYVAQKQLSTWMLSCFNLNANNHPSV